MTSCIIFGYTGAVGKSLFRHVMDDDRYSKVTTVGRRETGPYDGPNPGKLVQVVVDFENLEASNTAFQNHQVAFCALGTTEKIAGTAENFLKIDKDYVVNAAKLIARESPDCHFIYISSDGASKSSLNLYFKSKGLTEHELNLIPKLLRVSILRPKLLELEERREGEQRFGAGMVEKTLPVIKKISPKGFSVPIATVARAMINIGLQPVTERFHIYLNKEIHAEGAEPEPIPVPTGESAAEPTPETAPVLS